MKINYKLLLVAMFLSLTSISAQAQNTLIKNGKYRVVFQLSSPDTLVYKSLLKQLQNLQAALPGAEIEVVTHGPGVAFLQKSSVAKNSIEKLKSQGVTFLVCRNTLKEKNIPEASLLPAATIIPAGLAHIIVRQSEGWSYIKAGF